MIRVKKIVNLLVRNKIKLCCGVPDSVLKNLTSEFDKDKRIRNIITPNEGSSVALATGHYLSEKKLACVYLQNSGLGNAINPLSSITHKKVYSIPMLLMIGWRGANGKNDEPQHVVKGLITKKILSLLEIRYLEINSKNLSKIQELISYSKKYSVPVACLFKNNSFKKKKINSKIIVKNGIKRSLFIIELLKNISKNTKIISTTGYTSRELYQIRNETNCKKGKDFYMVGGMGHASMMALGISLNKKEQIVCLDGDGSFLMHLGSLNSIGKFGKNNFKHIMFNNNVHESVGGQTTYSENIQFKKLIDSFGYKSYKKIDERNDLNKEIKKFLKLRGPSFLEVKTSIGTLANLTRPKNLIRVKNDFKN
tara:strand:+ start:352 stop:1449 length:1098 start_codon:yes stop_codon:yes gene_type:complete